MSTTNVLLIALGVLVSGTLLGWFLNNRFGSRSLEAARARCDEMLGGARRSAQKEKQAALLDTRKEILAQRDKADKDLRNRKRQLQTRDRELRALRGEVAEREAELGRKLEELKEAELGLDAQRQEVEQAREHASRLVDEQNTRLERVSGLTREEAKRQLLANLEAQARYDAAQMIRDIKDQAQRTAENEAVKIIALAVERAASDFSAERTVSHFQLPEGSDLKGRIIGQEGKNIRAFEKATGIQLLIDEDSNSLQLSGFNPVRREIARRALETLIKDGNIHPRRIEDLVRRNRRRLDEEMKKAGQEALRELRIKGVHPEIVKLLGRLRFRTSYGQNVLDHSKEVAYLTGMLAAELRLDEKLARRAGLLHDIGKAIDYEREGTHPEIGAEVGKKFGEDEVVINAIASHHEDCEVTSPISVLVSAADSLSGARPGARRASVAEYIKRIERLEELANSMQGVEQSYALHAGREIRVIAKSKLVDDARVDLLATDLANRIQSEMDYPGKIKVTVIRETRAVDYAS
jgi:ribonuclease Y